MLLLALAAAGDGLALRPASAARREGTISRLVWAGPLVDPLGAPSPDSSYIAITDWATGNLAIRETATGAVRSLTENCDWCGWAEFPVPSPDGNQIAYAWFNEKAQRDLRVYSLETSSTRIVYAQDEVENPQPFAWTPDGSRVLAVLARADRTCQIALITVADGSALVLKAMDWRSPQQLAISPDGRYVAYDFPRREDSPERDIFLLADDAAAAARFGDASGQRRRRGLDARRQSAPLRKRSYGPLRYMGGFPNVRPPCLRLPGTRPLRRAPVSVHGPHPPGRPLLRRSHRVLRRLRGGPGRRRRRRSRAAGLALATVRRLEPLAGLVGGRPLRGLCLPAGIGAALGGLDGRDSVVRSLASGEEREITPRLAHWGFLARWSPDGRSFLVFGRDTKGHAGIFTLSAETGEATLVVRHEPPGFVQFPAWSSDGESLFYMRTTPEASNRLHVRNLTTGADREVFSRKHEQRRAVSRRPLDGRAPG